MDPRHVWTNRIRRFGWALFILGSPLGRAAAGQLVLLLAWVLGALFSATNALVSNIKTPVSKGSKEAGERSDGFRFALLKDPFFLAAHAFLGAAVISAFDSRYPGLALLIALTFFLILRIILIGSAELVGLY